MSKSKQSQLLVSVWRTLIVERPRVWKGYIKIKDTSAYNVILLSGMRYLLWKIMIKGPGRFGGVTAFFAFSQ